jgi:hypothetical protein
MLMNRFGALLVLGFALGLGACDNPVEDEHEGAVGLVVVNAQDQEVASFVVGSTVTGQIAVPVGTTTFTVFAVAEDGDRVDIDGTEYELVAAVVGDLATAAVQSNNRLAVTATQSGTGMVQLTLRHEGHEEFRTLVPLVVGS